MICRARPKYLCEQDIRKALDTSKIDISGEKEFYLNSASGAFYFFLRCYSEVYHKTPSVAIQALTCKSMLDAIINAGCNAYIYDITMEDLSIDYRKINFKEIDILVLTSYQGIPSKNYLKISEICRKENVILFEDLCHGKESYIGSDKLGSRCNAYIESYYFDKPYTAITGGKLYLNNISIELGRYISAAYKKIQKERNGKKELKLLDFLMKYTSENVYNEKFDYNNFIKFPFFYKIWIYGLGKYDIYIYAMSLLYKICNRINDKMQKKKSNQLYRMDVRKIVLIQMQENRFKNRCQNINVSSKLGLENSFENSVNKIIWNRYSIIDKNGKIKKQLQQEGFCVGNYNWVRGLHQIKEIKDNDKVKIISDCKNTEYVCQHILNIPIWQFYLKE